MLRPSNANRKRAAQLHAQLFADGLGFLKLRYIEHHAESARRIDLIKEEGLREDLARLVGKEFVDELHAAHKAYGDALGITKAGEASVTAESLLEPLRVLGRAISAYALQVLAFAGLDPANVVVARRALEPIDKFRAAAAKRSAAGGATARAPGQRAKARTMSRCRRTHRSPRRTCPSCGRTDGGERAGQVGTDFRLGRPGSPRTGSRTL